MPIPTSAKKEHATSPESIAARSRSHSDSSEVHASFRVAGTREEREPCADSSGRSGEWVPGESRRFENVASCDPRGPDSQMRRTERREEKGRGPLLLTGGPALRWSGLSRRAGAIRGVRVASRTGTSLAGGVDRNTAPSAALRNESGPLFVPQQQPRGMGSDEAACESASEEQQSPSPRRDGSADPFHSAQRASAAHRQGV